MNGPFVITRLCRDCVDGDCVDVCPVECIVVETDRNVPEALPNQLFINPDECISCGLCEPACPWDAIYEAADLPEEFKEDEALNAIVAEQPERFEFPNELSDREKPNSEDVASNKRRWKLSEAC